VIGRRALLLAGAALPASVSAYGQCVTDTMVVDACLGGVRIARPAGATLDLNFMSAPLDPRITFTRASTATYTDASGTIQTAATNAPRWDYASGVLRGLLIEEARTNIALQSSMGVAPWAVFSSGSGDPAVTANNIIAPDGTLTGTRVVYPAVSSGGAVSFIYQNITVAAVIYTFSIWLRGAVGGEQIYFNTNSAGVSFARTPRLTLTTQWRRFILTTPALTAASWTFELGTDLRDASQAATAAQTIYAWGAQVEAGAFATSYIPTTAATVTRAQDVVTMPVGSWFDQTKGSLSHEYIMAGTAIGYGAAAQLVGAATATDYIVPEQYDSSSTPSVNAAAVSVGATLAYCLMPTTSAAAGPIHKSAASWAMGAAVNAAHDGVGKSSDSGNITALPTITSLTIGGTMHGQTMVSQWARRTQYWPRQQSQTELIQVTT
jgi:hypothetical protein